MKRKLLLVGMLGFTILFGCSQASNEVSASLPNSFNPTSKDIIDSVNVFKIQDKDTGCYYLFGTTDYGTSHTPSATQMFIEKNGVTVPYCEEVK